MHLINLKVSMNKMMTFSNLNEQRYLTDIFVLLKPKKKFPSESKGPTDMTVVQIYGH